MTLPANIRVNVRAPFPTRVNGAAFIEVSKSNGIWTIKPDYRLLAQNPSLTPTQVVALQDTLTGVWSYTNANLFLFGALGKYRIITSAGAVTVQTSDLILLMNASPAGTSTINLPLSVSRSGAPVIIKDLAGNANTDNITIAPAAGETIDGL